MSYQAFSELARYQLLLYHGHGSDINGSVFEAGLQGMRMAPLSAILCGSQGSGKSHTLSCMLENCLLAKQLLPRIGKNSNALASLILHYDVEAVGNYMRWKEHSNIKIRELRLLSIYLDTERVKMLMAVGREGEMPLYMQLLIKILHDMACKTGGIGAFNYRAFKKGSKRRKLLESFLSLRASSESDYLTSEPRTLTIVDLTDPAERAKIVVLDEAHNYISNNSTAAKTFTDKLLKTVRGHRHLAARVVIATQEPTINTQLLDMCSITMVRRCTSLAWFAVLKKPIAAIYLNSMSNSHPEEEEVGERGKGTAKDDKALFQWIVRLRLGESLFCPTAAVRVAGGATERMEDAHVRFGTRQRVTADGGLGKLAGDK
ncbi:hypothetical protein K469DRAFT_724153 [Zopfia rhizophila CBS 207.26]|uniref:AAA+ ATPase domain-containing protein n=1 Tax=Zopfia rhizophila CBS 207.26 TaxID=1314779 RepID=A0A6A6DAZ8_9PEZI|nr:hypothetical protein K469DRAFT_724153 [Zopfia rhizophila CBS 207.26]